MDKVRLGIAGCGNAMRLLHLPALIENPDIELIATCDTALGRAREVCSAAGAKAAYDDFELLLQREDIDAIDICMPTHLHAPMILAALRAGKHVFCEKPDALCAADFEPAADLARDSSRVLMVMRNNRFLPTSGYARRYIARGALGKPYFAKCGWIRRRGIPGRGSWITTRSMAGGGPLIDLGIHMIDLALWLMGNPRPVTASGSTYRAFAGNEAPPDSSHAQFGGGQPTGTFDVEDLAAGYVRLDNGASLQLEFSWASNIERETRFVQIYGDKAGILWRDGDLSIYGEDDACLTDSFPRLPAAEGSGHAENIAHFASVVLGREKPVYAPDQGLDLLRVIDALYLSAREGREIQLSQ